MDNLENAIEREIKKAEAGMRFFEKKLEALPKGVLRMKTVRGRQYGYLAQRAGRKVKFDYIGIVSEDAKAEYGQTKLKRAEYTSMLTSFKQRLRVAARLMALKKKLAQKEKLKTLDEVKAILARYKAAIRKRFGVRKIGVFGSYARKEHRKNSDIDILVEYTDNAGPGFEFFELERYLKKVLKIKKVDLATVGSLKEGMKDAILKEVKFI